MARHRQYGLPNLILDLVLVAITGGFWILWILIRQFRSR